MSAAGEVVGGSRASLSISNAAAWLASGGSDETKAVVPQIRQVWGLSAKEAIDAIRKAQELRGARP